MMPDINRDGSVSVWWLINDFSSEVAIGLHADYYFSNFRQGVFHFMKRQWLLLLLPLGLIVVLWSMHRISQKREADSKPWAILNSNVALTKPKVLEESEVKVEDVMPMSDTDTPPSLPKETVDALSGALKEHLTQYPKDTDGWFNLGNTYYRGGRYEDAIEPLRKAIGLHPEDVDAHFILGNTYQRLKRYVDAAREFRQVVQLEPRNESAYYNLGNAYRALQDYKSAVEAYDKSIQINEKNAMVHYMLAACYSQLNKEQEAIAEYNRALQIDPNNAQGHYLLALLQIKNGDQKGAMEQHDFLMKINPQYAAEIRKRINPQG